MINIFKFFPVSGNSSYLINRGGGEIFEFENDKY